MQDGSLLSWFLPNSRTETYDEPLVRKLGMGDVSCARSSSDWMSKSPKTASISSTWCIFLYYLQHFAFYYTSPKTVYDSMTRLFIEAFDWELSGSALPQVGSLGCPVWVD